MCGVFFESLLSGPSPCLLQGEAFSPDVTVWFLTQLPASVSGFLELSTSHSSGGRTVLCDAFLSVPACSVVSDSL